VDIKKGRAIAIGEQEAVRKISIFIYYPSIIKTLNATGFRLTSTLSAFHNPNSLAIKMMCFLVTTPVIYRSLPFLKYSNASS